LLIPDRTAQPAIELDGNVGSRVPDFGDFGVFVVIGIVVVHGRR